MIRRLERDALRADLSAVHALLEGRDQEDDPVGFFQFSRRKAALEASLVALGEQLTTNAAVALFFAGRPVLGSRGIKAGFGARAIESFQALVTNTLASSEGPVGSRGPVKQSDRSQLVVSDVTRGSFGFVLEEAGEPQIVDTPVKSALDDVVNLISRSASADEEEFDLLTVSVEDRVLGSLTGFFRTLDEAGATVRVVAEAREFSLDRASIKRARDRIDGMEISETIEHLTGRVYVLPHTKRFEMRSEESGPISGDVHHECLRRVADDNLELPLGFSDTERDVVVRHRVVRLRNRADRNSYTLLSITQ